MTSRAGFVAVIGAPNAGKSTLVNAIVGSKVTIVSRKVQTTRFAIRGVAIEGDAQMILVDTPGIFTPRRRLDRAMVRAAWTGAKDADAIIHLIDAEAHDRVAKGVGRAADRLSVRDSELIRDGLKAAGLSATLTVNKIDQVKRDHLLELVDGFFDADANDRVFMVSASTGSGVADLKRELVNRMPQGPWLYPADQASDIPLRLLAAEITREKLYQRVHEELPYSAAVETTAHAERTDGSLRLEQTILVEREGQRGIVIGKNGATLKWIGRAAREELSEILGRSVHLFVHVKVRSGWAEDRALFENVGLEFDA